MPEEFRTDLKAVTSSPSSLIKAHEQDSAFLARASELMVDAGRAIWESQNELFKAEAEQVAKALVPPQVGEDSGAILSALCEQWHGSSDRTIAHLRRINDVGLDCGWKLLGNYADGLRQAAEELHFQPWPHCGHPAKP